VNKPVCRLAGVVFAFALLSSAVRGPVLAQSGSSISGVVFDHVRTPVAKLWIELLDEVDSVIQRTRTDGSGRYVFSRLSNGVFQVRVVTFGTIFAPETRRVTLAPGWTTLGTRSVNEQVDFYLTKASPGSPAPPVGGTLFAQDVPADARRTYDAAVALLDAGKDPQGGIARLEEAVRKFPSYYQALERLGVELVRLGRFEPAIVHLDNALRVNPGGQGSHYALGVAQYRLKKYAEATASLRRMLSLAPNAPNAPFADYFLGLALIRAGSPKEAESHLKRASEHPGEAVPSDVHMALAQIYSGSSRYREAADELEQFLRQTPDARDAEKVREIARQLRAKQR
jgi:Flp pilus assembly protein TadD